MTTELEKQFFDTFGIKPKKGCTAYDKLEEHEADTICNDECLECLYFDDRYPQITDHILLKLICICSQYGFCPTARNIKDLKLNVLKRLLELKKNLKNNYKHQSYHNAFTRKVQAMFKE